MRDAKPLLFVDNHQPQIFKPDVLLHNAVGADDDIGLPPAQLVEHREQLHLDREAFNARERRLVMLPGQDGRRHQNRALFALDDAFKRGAQRNFGLAEAHVPAEQPLHWARRLHILLDLGDTAQLVVGLLIGKLLLEFMLPLAVR